MSDASSPDARRAEIALLRRRLAELEGQTSADACAPPDEELPVARGAPRPPRPAGAASARATLPERASVARESVSELRRAMRRAEAATRAKSEFLANMSHELRTPMTAILGYTEVLIEEGDMSRAPAPRVEALRAVHRNAQHLLRMLSEILDLSKIEAGRIDLERVPVAPHEIVSDLELMLRNTAEAKRIGFEVAMLGGVPERIETDPTRLRQILVNLVGNAIKFTEQGGVRLHVRTAPGTTPGTPRLVFSVSDTGPGLAPEACERIFEPFSQADSSTTRRYGGTGLGLTISRHLARLLGGDIELQTLEGRGSTFTLWIPLVLPAADGHSGAPAQPAPSSQEVREFLEHVRASGRSGRVLLVEDGADNRALLSFTLGKAGFRVTHAENGQIGCELALAALANGQPFDVVLMDMQMPVLDGYQATRRLRAADYAGPILALTAHAMQGNRETCLAAGCSDFLTKPIDRRQLVLTVLRHMESRKSAGG